MEDAALRSLRQGLLGVWPDLLSVVKIPIEDTLDPERDEIAASARGAALDLRFDLEVS